LELGTFFKNQYQVSLKDVDHSQCVSVNDNVELKFYKKYSENLTNHPDLIERNLDLNSLSYHNEYNYYRIKEQNNDFLVLANKFDQEFQIKITNNKDNFKYKECVSQKLDYTIGSCLEYTNIRTGNKSFWKVEDSNNDNYSISGIYNSFLTNKIIQDGQSNKTFRHYNPELAYPLQIDKFQINQSSKTVICPEKIVTKFKEKDCLKYKNITAQVVSKNTKEGIFEIKILEQGTSLSRVPASINQELDKMISNIEKEKIKHGWQDLYFLDQDSAELIKCK
jgi:hypothetical protein